TWYRTRYWPVRSNASTSPGWSTTHTTLASRRASVQIRHGSCSLKLPHLEQNPTCSRSARVASASRSASSRGARSRCSASRCALFWPMAGSLPSSSIRSSRYFELYMRSGRAWAESERQLEAAGELAERVVHVRLRAALRLAHRRDDEV